MAKEFYIKQRMQTIELNLNMIIDINPHLINVNHRLVRNYSNVPFK